MSGDFFVPNKNLTEHIGTRDVYGVCQLVKIPQNDASQG